MDENIRWIKLTKAEIRAELKKFGIDVSNNIVRKLLKKHKFVKRKMQRKKRIGNSESRDKQFKNIHKKKREFLKTDNPIISVDTKKKENLGNLYREGSVYCTQAIETYDHDYPHLATGKIVPHGIFDIKANTAHINIGLNNETAEFICDSIKNWWNKKGKNHYSKANNILVLCDAGGANSYLHNIFKVELQKLSDSINMSITIAHYPPYTNGTNLKKN